VNLKIGKEMKIIWTDFASDTLAEIYIYYKEVAGE
jgi:hypothetical protein